VLGHDESLLLGQQLERMLSDPRAGSLSRSQTQTGLEPFAVRQARGDGLYGALQRESPPTVTRSDLWIMTMDGNQVRVLNSGSVPPSGLRERRSVFVLVTSIVGLPGLEPGTSSLSAIFK
jgi:hypothetical protein